MLRYYVLLLLVCYTLIILAEMDDSVEVKAIICTDENGSPTFIGLESEKTEYKYLTLGNCPVVTMSRGELRKYKRRFYEGRR